jgi:hypothetical protein
MGTVRRFDVGLTIIVIQVKNGMKHGDGIKIKNRESKVLNIYG